MSGTLSVSDLVRHMPIQFGDKKAAPVAMGPGSCIAMHLRPTQPEVSAPPSDAHIVSLITRGADHHEQRHDGRQVFDGPLLASRTNVVRAGVSPWATTLGLEVMHLYIPDKMLREKAARLGRRRADGDLNVFDPCFEPEPVLEALLTSLHAMIFAKSAAERLFRDSLVESIVCRILQRWTDAGDLPEVGLRGGLAPWQLKRACEAMIAQLGGNPGLDDLAAVAGCSPTHFSRAFKQSTGLAPFHWLAERRIEAAKALLQENRLSLAEIALAVGFAAQPQFTTAFGRATGMTPGAWRRARLS